MLKLLETARVFFIGAGFSAGANIPLTNVLLPKAAELFRLEAPGLFERISWFASDADVDLYGNPGAPELARLCTQLDFMELREHGGGERWSSEGSRERLALKYFLAKAVATSSPPTAELPDFYHRFAKSLRSTDVIVSFNWDTLVENLLSQVGIPYSYTGEEGKLLLMKLHGSVHWCAGPVRSMARDAPNLQYQPVGFDEHEPKKDVHFSNQLRSPGPWWDSRCLVDQVRPLIVLPGYGKAVDVRLLSAIWYKPEAVNIRQGGISVIGLSVADDDYIVDGLLRYLLRSVIDDDMRVRVINPDPTVGELFSKLGAGRKIEFVEDRFSAQTVDLALLDAANV